MPKDTRKKDRAYKASMLLKYWKATIKEPIMDLCMIIAMYTQDIEAGLLYAVGYSTALTTDSDEEFEFIDALSRITLQNKDGGEALVKSVMNGSDRFHAFLFENGTVRVIISNGSIFDIALESDIIAMNSGDRYNSLFIVDAKMRAYEINDAKQQSESQDYQMQLGSRMSAVGTLVHHVSERVWTRCLEWDGIMMAGLGLARRIHGE